MYQKIPQEYVSDIYYYKWIKEYCENNQIKYTEIDSDYVCEINNISIKCLSTIDTIDTDDLNQYSLVLKVKIFNKSIIYTGDIGWHTEYKLLDKKEDLKANILKVGHHGSYDSTASAFLENVNPDYAVISVSKDEEFKIPHPNVLQRLSNENVVVYRTDVHGNIEFLLSPTNITVLNK